MQIVVNRCFGGFRLSDAAGDELKKLGMKVADADNPLEDGHGYDLYHSPYGGVLYIGSDVKTFRCDPKLIAVVLALGPLANGGHAKLEVIGVPSSINWYIHDYDGRETIEEEHRSW
jgi:hypothetical protein